MLKKKVKKKVRGAPEVRSITPLTCGTLTLVRKLGLKHVEHWSQRNMCNCFIQICIFHRQNLLKIVYMMMQHVLSSSLTTSPVHGQHVRR